MNAEVVNEQSGQKASADILSRLVPRIRYKPGWSFELLNRERTSEHLAGSEGLTLVIRAKVFDSGPSPREVRGYPTTRVAHLFAPPPAAWNERTWRRWVFDCAMQVELHEAMEFFADGDHRPFFPAHGIGEDPYEVCERGVIRL